MDNCIIVCSIENVDPMGIHTGDSITVAPAQTLTDKEYQIMRDASMQCCARSASTPAGRTCNSPSIRRTAGMLVIEMNPRVSRSSALASKATGFPIAKVAAKLAVGYTLDELKNEITGGATPASFERASTTSSPRCRASPREFPQANDRLTTQMKSSRGDAIGRTFQESVPEGAARARGRRGGLNQRPPTGERIEKELGSRDRSASVRGRCLRKRIHARGMHQLTHTIRGFSHRSRRSSTRNGSRRDRSRSWIANAAQLKAQGVSDRRPRTGQRSEAEVRAARHRFGIRPVYKRVDTCARNSRRGPVHVLDLRGGMRGLPTQRKKVIVLGGGPNRIGQGIESIIAACTRRSRCGKTGSRPSWRTAPETVSTDYDTPIACTSSRSRSRRPRDRRQGEALRRDRPFGGQTP